MMKLPSLKQNFSQLIATPSISSLDPKLDTDNQPVLDLLESWLTDLGFECQRQAVPGSRGKHNLVAKYGSGDGGILFAGHTDTVPFDDSGWHSDPFAMTEKDDKWYGLGTCDMKGFFAIVAEALSQLPLKNLKRPVYVFASADEETTMAGAKALAADPIINPDFAIIGEPTGLQPVYLHKGHMATGIRVHGRSGHSSDPDNGLNAIGVMHKVLSQLMKLQEYLKSNYSTDDFTVGYPTLNFGKIEGGDAANRICGCCELHIDIRPLPGLALAELNALVVQFLSGLQQEYPNCIDVKELYPGAEPFKGDNNNAFSDLVAHVTGKQPMAVNYATEAPYIQSLGCQTLVLGPGSIDQAHQPNEYLALDQLQPSVDLIKTLVHQCCSQANMTKNA
ncbi:acetylornithine deacetylase [Paraferrimonas sedimenticola]|uniref:Acetylornithine deacetylase n=1 Tax=Paraferrimonas sedimenticola TaxID=375674 RepID=A0AA37RVH2_9GAMM|nr:acetylornithine deacetylase [Paraferrimonas sedimenticola]GLP95989.1 acetylornithine deacetylase [Paraferrimonas sedimenticola]